MTSPEQFLAEAFPAARLVSLEPLAGGHSGHTLVAQLEGADVEGQRVDRVVVKSGAPGRPPHGRHDVLRQARVFEFLSGAPGVRVPRVLATDAGDPNQFAMTFAPGDSTEPILDGVGSLPPDVVEGRSLAAIRALAALHAVPVDDGAAATLAAGPPSALTDEVDRWDKVLQVVDQSLVEGWHELADGLRGAVPASERVAVVHGDYRLGNLLCDGTDVTAIIDWEIWTLADPRVDLGWTLLFCDPDRYPGVSFPAPGMPTVQQMLAEYETVGGTVADVDWFLAFGCFKTAAIMSHNLKRHREGRYHDPYQERLPPTIAEMVRHGRAVLAGGTDGAA